MSNNDPFSQGQQPSPRLNINVSDLTDFACAECQGKYFRQITLFKRLSPLVSPTGKEQLIPVPSFRCDDCGHVNEEFAPKLIQE